MSSKQKMRSKNQSVRYHSIDEVVNAICDPIQRSVMHKRIGNYDESSKIARRTLQDPKSMGVHVSHQWNYVEMLNKLHQNQIPIHPSDVEEWIKQGAHSSHFVFTELGIMKEILATGINLRNLRSTGEGVYETAVAEGLRKGSWYFIDYLPEYLKNIEESFKLPKSFVNPGKRRVFKAVLTEPQPHRDLYEIRCTFGAKLPGKEESLPSKLISNLSMNLNDAHAELTDYVLRVSMGESFGDRSRNLRNAVKILNEFGRSLNLNDDQKKNLCRQFLKDEKSYTELVRKYLPEEVYKEEKKRREEMIAHSLSDSATSFGSREDIKREEPFNSPRFVAYDRRRFLSAIKSGYFVDAYTIAKERDYEERSLLEKLLKYIGDK